MYIARMVRARADADVFAVIADPTRRRILGLLGTEGAQTVSEINRPLRMSQPALSQHLRVLRDARLVQQERSGRFRRYTLNPEGLKEVYEWVSFFSRFWDEKLDALGHYLDKNRSKTQGKRS